MCLGQFTAECQRRVHFGALEGVTLPATFRGPVSTVNFCFPNPLETGCHLFLAVAGISRLSFCLTGHRGPKVRLREGAGRPILFPDTEGKRQAAGLEACFAINDTDAHLASGPRTCSQSFQERSRDGFRARTAIKLKCGL